jgi:enoyl-CoA hydratase/carnithine racemase
MTADGETILYTSEGGVATITLNRPHKLNAMTVAMDRRINELVYEINNDDEVRVVVLAGAGDRAFCVGSDITDLDGYGTSWQYRNRFDRNLDYAIGIWKIRKPVIAAIHGYCIGGGLEMACASDVRLGTVASSFAAGEINWGWHGGSGATQFLTRVVGPGLASEILLGGEQVSAERVAGFGLLNRVFDTKEEVLAEASRLASVIASHSPIPTQAVKKLVRVAQSASVDVGLAYENDLFAYEMNTRDAAEGRAAFAEKRIPEFRGE